MNTIQRYIPFYDLAMQGSYTLNTEVLKSRELIIFGVATTAFTSLALTFLTTIGKFTLNITLLKTGIFAGVLLVSLMFSRLIASKFYEWDKARNENAIIKNRFDSLELNHKGSYNWLVNCDDAISMIHKNDVSLKVLQKLLGFAIKYKKNSLIDFLWNKLVLSEKKEVLIDLYMQQKNPHPKLLKWLVNNIDALKLLLDNKGVDLCKLSSATNPKNILTTAILMDNCEAFTLLLDSIASNAVEVRNFFLEDALKMVLLPDYDWYFDNVDDKNELLSFLENFVGDTIEELELFLLQRFPPNPNHCSTEEESGDEQVYELFGLLKGLRNINSKELYAKVAFLLSFENDNIYIPEFLIKNKMVRATQFTKIEQANIIVQCLNPFKSKYVRIRTTCWVKNAITDETLHEACAYPYLKKISKTLKRFTPFSLCNDYDKYQDIWVERLVKLGFDLDAKGPYKNVEWVFNNFDVRHIGLDEIETDGFLKGTHLEAFNEGIKSRCDFITNLRKKIFLERLPLIHHLITENAIYDVARQILNFYDALSLRPLKQRI